VADDKKHRLQIQISKNVLKTMDRLKDELELSSRVAVVQRSVRFLDKVMQIINKGGKIIRVDADGKEETLFFV